MTTYFYLNKMTIRICLVCLCVFAISISGCKKGIDANLVEGLVTLDGQPLAGASVTFYDPNDDSKTAGGFSNEKGVYRLTPYGGQGGEGAFTGDYVVTVTKSETVPLPKPITYDDGSVSTETTQHILLPVYRDRKNTPLKFPVVKGKNKIDLELKSSL